MYVFHHIADLRAYLAAQAVNARTIGFVPTMGALHQGHAQLIRTSLARHEITVCSIFVNPTQFNDPADLEKYPRTPGKDLALLSEVGCQVVFLPEVDEIYPSGGLQIPDIDLGGLDLPMEGAKRPGHFKGVVQVVKRLLDIVQPHVLYMGQKDYQQLAIVRRMAAQLALPLRVEGVPTQREDSGLAMSSRNERLSPEQRATAAAIFQTLNWGKTAWENGTPAADIGPKAMQLLRDAGFDPEYFQIVDGHTLQEITTEKPDLVVACTAAWLGGVRLIDNMVYQTN